MEKILQGFDITCYIDDIGIWTKGTLDEHLELVDKVLQRIVGSNLKTNPLKCNWEVTETDFLGYKMTPISCKTIKNKIDALLKMSALSNRKQVRSKKLLGSYQLLQAYVAKAHTRPCATCQASWAGPF